MGLRGSKVLHTQLLDSVVGTHLRFFQVIVTLAVYFRFNTAIAVLQAVVKQHRTYFSCCSYCSKDHILMYKHTLQISSKPMLCIVAGCFCMHT
jgi:hypothetical protein